MAPSPASGDVWRRSPGRLAAEHMVQPRDSHPVQLADGSALARARYGCPAQPADASTLGRAREFSAVELQGAMKQVGDELKAVLKAELKSGLDLLHGQWGDPLDDKSKLRQGLRAEMQVQLRMAMMGETEVAAYPSGGVLWCHQPPLKADAGSGPHCGSFAPFSPGSPGQRRAPSGDELDLAAVVEAANEEIGDIGKVSCGTEGDSTEDSNQQKSRGDEDDDTMVNLKDQLRGLRLRGQGQSRSASSDDRRGNYAGAVASGAWRRMNQMSSEALWSRPEGNTYTARLRRLCVRLAHSFLFDVFMGIAICINSICVGAEIQWDLEDMPQLTQVTRALEHFFLSLFVLELFIRILADGRKAWESGWFIFDTILVVVGVLATWIMEPILAHFQGNSGGQQDSTLELISQVLIMRILRLLRLIRALRLMEQFRELWKLANGLMSSFRTVLSACMLVMITIYIFACLGIELITMNSKLQDDPITRDIVELHFRSLPTTMLTLVQFANADSIAGVYAPLVTQAWYLVFYFGAVWLIVTISLMNLVTAVIVDNAISQGGMDREMEVYEKRKMLKLLTPTVRNVFRALDKSNDGYLQLSEVKAGLDNMKLPDELKAIMQVDKLVDLFEFLDADASGEVDEEEFLDGVFHLTLQAVPIETTQTLQLLRSQMHAVQLIKELQCLRACEGSVTTLASDHEAGSSVLNVISGPAIEIEGGDRSEQRFVRPSAFTLSLDKPLKRRYPKDSNVSQVTLDVRGNSK